MDPAQGHPGERGAILCLAMTHTYWTFSKPRASQLILRVCGQGGLPGGCEVAVRGPASASDHRRGGQAAIAGVPGRASRSAVEADRWNARQTDPFLSRCRPRGGLENGDVGPAPANPADRASDPAYPLNPAGSPSAFATLPRGSELPRLGCPAASSEIPEGRQSSETHPDPRDCLRRRGRYREAYGHWRLWR